MTTTKLLEARKLTPKSVESLASHLQNTECPRTMGA